MKSPPPPPPPITSCIPMRTDKRGIPIVQTSPLHRTKRLTDEEDDIRLCKGRNDYFARTFSPTKVASSPRLDSWQDASTEPMFPQLKKPLYSPRPQPSIYMNRKLKRKADDFGLNSPCSKISRLSNSQDQKLDDTPPQTQSERMFELERVDTDRVNMVEKMIQSPKMRIQSIIEPKMIEPIQPKSSQPVVPEPQKQKPQIQDPQINEPEDMIIDPPDTANPPSTESRKPTKEEEEARVAEEIDHLMKTVKGLPDYYKLIDKIGEGTFSTVYKALDIRRDLYHNQDWEPQLLASEEEKRTINQYVALKRIYHTSSPRRIANEVYILRKLIGSPCISPLITAFRQQDQVFVVMPYIPHDDFKKTFFEMPMVEIKSYIKALFTALHYLHKQHILHRDVKPNNFLYNRRKRTGYLIDFGLAENEDEGRKLEEYAAKIEAKSQNNMFIQSSRAAALSHTPTKSSTSSPSVLVALTNKENRASTSTEAVERKVVGYVKNDARHQVRANRAGTRGFRAPEILMKVTRQTCAIDIWAAGVILSCFLTGRYPFFLANEESDAIIELAQIYGYREMKKCAASHGRTFSTNINIPTSKVPWSKLAEHLNKETIQSWDPKDYKDALDLLERCMDLNHKTRITATEALQHPFLSS